MFTLLSAAALAAAPVALPSTLVRHADLDLTTRSGRNSLDHRIERAARQVCRPETSLGRAGDTRRCVRETIAKVRADRDRLIAARSASLPSVAAR